MTSTRCADVSKAAPVRDDTTRTTTPYELGPTQTVRRDKAAPRNASALSQRNVHTQGRCETARVGWGLRCTRKGR
eukprot:12137674-Heterocapsa_arctica.AAC.1